MRSNLKNWKNKRRRTPCLPVRQSRVTPSWILQKARLSSQWHLEVNLTLLRRLRLPSLSNLPKLLQPLSERNQTWVSKSPLKSHLFGELQLKPRSSNSQQALAAHHSQTLISSHHSHSVDLVLQQAASLVENLLLRSPKAFLVELRLHLQSRSPISKVIRNCRHRFLPKHPPWVTPSTWQGSPLLSQASSDKATPTHQRVLW